MSVARELSRDSRRDKDILARYGGDEFLLLFPGTDPSTVEARIRAVGRRLSKLTQDGAVPFPMSFSHGVVDSGGFADAEGLLAAVDRKMYQDKKGLRANRPNGKT